MRTLLALVVGLAGCVGLVAQDRRAPSQAELAAGLQTAKPVQVLDGGQVVDRVSVSRDGRWLVYAYYEEDIHSNVIRMVSTNEKTRKEVGTPRGFKHTPLIWDNRLLFFALDTAEGSALPDGIYYGPWDGPADRWTLFAAGPFLNLSISDDGRYLAASTGRFDRPRPRTSIKVWPLGSSGAKGSEGYIVGSGVPGQVRQIAWGPQAQTLVVEINIEKPDSEWGQSNLYSMENRPGSTARLLRENGRRPVFWNQQGGPVLYFNEGDWQHSRLLALQPGQRGETLVATFENKEGLGLTANAMAWDQATRRLILGVQASATTAGLVGLFPP